MGRANPARRRPPPPPLARCSRTGSGHALPTRLQFISPSGGATTYDRKALSVAVPYFLLWATGRSPISPCCLLTNENNGARLDDSGRVVALHNGGELHRAYLSKNWPTLAIAYHDPNFAVRFGETMDVIEGLPEGHRNPYIMESSLSIAPGIESWNDYSAKSGTTRSSGREKLEQVVDHLTLIAQYVPGLQANFVFGTDQDRGTEPAELTKEFVRRTPFVWPIFNIPTPFGGTPLYDAYHGEGRILDQMPFALYYNPYLAITLKHYHPIEYYDHMIDLQSSNVAGSLQKRRILSATTHPTVKFIMALRTMRSRRDLRVYRLLRKAIASDPQMRAFHEGKRVGLPRFYDAIVERRLGRYAEILSKAERVPQLESPAARPSQFPGARATQPNTPSQDILESIRL